jgi:hypothetical protein
MDRHHVESVLRATFENAGQGLWAIRHRPCPAEDRLRSLPSDPAVHDRFLIAVPLDVVLRQLANLLP